jgi:hypothetical protein
MYETTSTFLQSELDYRTDRLKSGLAKSRRRDRRRAPRVPRASRPVATLRYAR